MSSIAGSSASNISNTPSRILIDRSHSRGSVNRQRAPTQGEGYAADDDDEEGDVEGDDGDDDDDEAHAGEDTFGVHGMLNETTIKSGYLWKRGEKRKVRSNGQDSRAESDSNFVFWQNWKKRWFALRSSKLCYYKNEKVSQSVFQHILFH